MCPHGCGTVGLDEVDIILGKYAAHRPHLVQAGVAIGERVGRNVRYEQQVVLAVDHRDARLVARDACRSPVPRRVRRNSRPGPRRVADSFFASG